MMFEDAHWADASTLEFLDLLVECRCANRSQGGWHPTLRRATDKDCHGIAGSAWQRGARSLTRFIGVSCNFGVLTGLANGAAGPSGGGVRFNRVELAAALRLAQQCLKLAQKAGFGLDLANCLLGQTLSSMGEFIAAKRHLQTVIDKFHDGMRDVGGLFSVDKPVLALAYMARILWALEYPERSEAAAREAIALARNGSNAVTVAVALNARVYVALHGLPLQEAVAYANEAVAYCKEHELALFEHWIRLHGAFVVRQGDTAAGIEIMRAAISAAEVRQSRQFRRFQLACVGAAYAELGDCGRALTTLDEAMSVAEAGGEKQSLATIHRFRGEILFRLGRGGEARHALDCALGIARRQQARLEEQRAAIALVRQASDSDRADARQALMTVYSKFEEGHTLPDLCAASDLLAPISAVRCGLGRFGRQYFH
jgi:tetratricopeptide (TPR) repeat protein